MVPTDELVKKIMSIRSWYMTSPTDTEFNTRFAKLKKARWERSIYAYL